MIRILLIFLIGFSQQEWAENEHHKFVITDNFDLKRFMIQDVENE